MALDLLVADDSSVMRKMLIRTMRIAGLPLGTVYEASNGATAVTLVRKRSVGLALLDINMPGMNGLEVLSRIRSDPRTEGLPVVVVSTEGSSRRIEEVRRNRAGFVKKPFTPDSLVDAVVHALGSAE